MGGYGSGRNEYATTPRVDESLEFDADDITDAVDSPGSTGWMEWGDEDDPTAELKIYFEDDGEDADRSTHLRLEYTITDRWSDTWSGEKDHVVPLEYTDCHFGGVRPWFRCPNRECRRRVRKLYFPRGAKYWLCRECYDLGYLSSRRSGNDLKEAELRYRRAFAKADKDNRRPHPNRNEPPFSPERPKGMHGDTFEELLADVREAREEWDRAQRAQFRELFKRAGIDPPLVFEE